MGMSLRETPATGIIVLCPLGLNILKSRSIEGPAGSIFSFRINITNEMAKTGSNTELANPCKKNQSIIKNGILKVS